MPTIHEVIRETEQLAAIERGNQDSAAVRFARRALEHLDEEPDRPLHLRPLSEHPDSSPAIKLFGRPAAKPAKRK